MSAPGTPYDSHPTPAWRIAWTERLENAPQLEPDERTAWSLFADPLTVQYRLTRLVARRFEVETCVPAGAS